MVSGTGTIKSEIVTADRPSRAVWKGHHGGIEAVHVWTIEPVGPTTTLVHTEESWSGLLPRILRKTLQATLKKSIDKGLPAMQFEAERRARRSRIAGDPPTATDDQVPRTRRTSRRARSASTRIPDRAMSI